MDNEVPFVANTPDDSHCLQAAYLMILKYFKPEMEIPWPTWSRLTGYEEDKGSWASAGLIWFKAHGFRVIHITSFNYELFSSAGGQYLLTAFGQEVGEWQIANTNMPRERARANVLIRANIYKKREPTIKNMKEYLDAGYLLRCMVNARALNGMSGYVGHAVVVKGYDSEGFIIHDPGLPPKPNRKVTYETFEQAWAYPNNEAKELDAIKLA
jgi:hypothetical protein